MSKPECQTLGPRTRPREPGGDGRQRLFDCDGEPGCGSFGAELSHLECQTLFVDMTLRAVFFDVGETLVDEERWWRELCKRSGLQPHVVWAALGVTIERGEEHDALWAHLGIERPAGWWEGLSYELDDLYPDAVACLDALRDLGLRVGIVGNQTSALERWARDAQLPADVISSSASLGVWKPDPRFFGHVVELAGVAPEEVAYVGDRVDNDVRPALAAGLTAVHVRRGPWGRLQRPPAEAIAIDSLAELPDALASLL